jgi:lipopolysaccharide/colanic/teichoic acid biosynthesis glycosyltransferase
MKRLLDILFSLGGILVLLPVFFVIWLAVRLDSHGPGFFMQTRVGRGNKDFRLFKFRTMRMDAEKSGQLTVGGRDPRITRAGHFLRKYKIDELPQLFNVLLGDMSFVGPRPEVRRYVDLYTPGQKQVLSVRPGITDYASLRYFNENEILGKSAQPEQDYIRVIMPEKLALNLEYMRNRSLARDIGIIFQTIARILTRTKE